MKRREFLKAALAAGAALALPTPAVARNIYVPLGEFTTAAAAAPTWSACEVVDGFLVDATARRIEYTGEPGHNTLPEVFHLLFNRPDVECVGFADPREEMWEGHD